jgi:isoleucyl-tRNA synthetase
VHLTAYPVQDEAAIDEELEASIDTVVRYKNLGLRLRNQANIKIRQPLGRLLVKPATSVERAALQRDELRQQILEELNVKSIELIDSSEGLAAWTVKPNRKVLGPKHGAVLKVILDHLGTADADVVRAAVQSAGAYRLAGPEGEIELLAEDLFFELSGPEHLEVGAEGESFVALDTTITPELRREGLARDFVRAVQSLRKQRDLNVMDRIVVQFTSGDDDLQSAVAEWSTYIKRETLADDVLQGAIESPEQVKVGGRPVGIAIELVESVEA